MLLVAGGSLGGSVTKTGQTFCGSAWRTERDYLGIDKKRFSLLFILQDRGKKIDCVLLVEYGRIPRTA